MAMKLLSTVTMTVIFILVLLTTTTATTMTNTRIMKITIIMTNTFGNGRFEFGRMKDKSEFRKYTFRLQFH